jgi:hypothetical protein
MYGKAFVSIPDFGSAEQIKALVELINRETLYAAYVNDNGVPVIPVPVSEIGDMLAVFAANPNLSWIEYRVQFDPEA